MNIIDVSRLSGKTGKIKAFALVLALNMVLLLGTTLIPTSETLDIIQDAREMIAQNESDLTSVYIMSSFMAHVTRNKTHKLARQLRKQNQSCPTARG